MKKYKEKLEEWIYKRVTGAGLKGTVLGASGGIDSSVVAVLCKNIFPEDTLALPMPCHSNPQDTQDALQLLQKFDIPHFTVDLSSVYEKFVETLMKNVDQSHYIAEANIKPRIRMTALYYYANIYNYMVVGTGNKSELMTGYFTKFGDGAADIEPLGSLYKTEVYELAEELGIPKNIINKEPSAGLWLGQTDKQEMGITYEEMDEFLKKGTGSEHVKTIVSEMIEKSSHKRKMPEIPGF